MKASDRVKKVERPQVSKRTTSVIPETKVDQDIFETPTKDILQDVKKEEKTKKTTVILNEKRLKSLQTLCVIEEISTSTLLEAFDLISNEHPEAREAIIAKARELSQARKELGDQRRSKSYSKRVRK